MSINPDIEKEIDALNIVVDEKTLMKQILLFELEKSNSTKGTKTYTNEYNRIIDDHISGKTTSSIKLPAAPTVLKKKISFLSIRLKNYRQYYGDSGKISLSPQDGKLINIIQGENGEGKSNILNAMNYCLYQEEPHFQTKYAGMPIVNIQAIDEAADGDEIEMIIELELGNEEIKYKIARKITFFKSKLIKKVDAKGNKIITVERVGKLGSFPTGTNPTAKNSFQWSTGKDWTTETNVEQHIHKLLPPGLKPFFFLDGEFLDEIATTFVGVKKGVDELSQLKLVYISIADIKKMVDSTEKQSRGTDDETDRFLQAKQDHNNWLESKNREGDLVYNKENPGLKMEEGGSVWYHPKYGIPREVSKKKELEFLKNRIHEIEEQRQKNNSALSEEWSKNRIKIMTLLPKKDVELEELKSNKIRYLVKEAPFAYLRECVEFSSNLIDKKRKVGQLPVKQNDIFVKDLLEAKECICGTDLHDEKARQNIINWQQNSSKDSKLDACVEIGVEFRNKLKNFKKEFSVLDKFRSDIIKLQDEIDNYEGELKELTAKLEGIDEEQLRELFREQTAKEKLRDTILGELAEDRVEIKRHERERNICQADYDRALKQNSKLKGVSVKLDLYRKLHSTFNIVRHNVTEKFQNSLGKNTEAHFKDLVWKETTFSDVVLQEDYSLQVLNGGYDVTPELSPGERLVLALSFIAAIRDISGYQFPLVIDTPIGKISETPKTNLGKFYPEYLSGTQLTLLVTGPEYESPILNAKGNPENHSVRKLIEEFVNVEYKLNYNEKKKQTTFGDYT